METMKVMRVIFSVILAGLLISCAGLTIKTDAQEEFDVGFSLYNHGKYEDAITHFRRSAELDPESGRAYLYLGRSYLSLGKWRDAVPPLRTAYRLAPEETKEEIADVLMDFLLQHLSEFDLDSESQIED